MRNLPLNVKKKIIYIFVMFRWKHVLSGPWKDVYRCVIVILIASTLVIKMLHDTPYVWSRENHPDKQKKRKKKTWVELLWKPVSLVQATIQMGEEYILGVERSSSLVRKVPLCLSRRSHHLSPSTFNSTASPSLTWSAVRAHRFHYLSS